MIPAVSDWPEWQWFESIHDLLIEIKDKSLESKLNTAGMVFPFIDSIVESSKSLRLLAKEELLRDPYVISRMIYETSINACFLLTEPEKLFVQMQTHAKQKALRSLVRIIEISGEKLFEYKPNGVDRYLEHPTHQEWLNEFTYKSGKEITSWTPENVQQRVEAVYLKFGHESIEGLHLGF